ncbi:MAG: beta-N-acetylhexosaminidase [Alphaproteobacteria bacterium]|nr:beta-N-acetylhexosaminidase [Alphaproteobacteria bacterium]
MSNPKAVIFGCQTTNLLPEEKAFFQRTNPLGFILFARNCETPEQIKLLVNDLRKSVKRPDAPILIDQEGGRVNRLVSPHWRVPPSAGTFGMMAEEDPEKASWCSRANAWLIGKELHHLGINVNCAPVVDVLHKMTHPIIGDRAFSYHPEVVATLALQAIKGYQEAGIISVIKHIPGHGQAMVDSHEKLPIVPAPLENLGSTDFEAFRQVCQYFKRSTDIIPWAMTAHVVYSAIDPSAPATQSSLVIDSVIRNHIGFAGFLISDCLTMKALEGNLGTRAKKSLEAGCDAVLHCNGVLEEMIEVAAQTPPLKSDSIRRLNRSIILPQMSQSFESEEKTLMLLNQNLRLEGLLSQAERL